MFRAILIACSLGCASAALAATAQNTAKTADKPAASAVQAAPAGVTAAQIVERNVAARGGAAAWQRVETLTYSGKFDAGGKPNVELPFVMRMKRGHKNRLELTFRDQTAVQVYDGAQGWKVRPFLNRNEVEPYTPAETRAAAEFDDLDGPLIDYAKKGTRIELLGVEKVEGSDAYKLRLTPKDGTQRAIWIDAKTYLEHKIEGEPKKIDGRLRAVSVYLRDYKAESGLITPRVLETVYEGTKVSRKMTIAKVTVNEPMQEALFEKPQLAMADSPVR